MRLLPKFWDRHFLIYELLIAILISVAFIYWFYSFNGIEIVKCKFEGNRTAIYGALASIFGSLLGFVITVTSIVLGYSTSEKLHVVRESSQYPKLWKIFSSITRALGMSTLMSLVCLLVDSDKSPVPFLIPLTFIFIAISLIRMARTIWAFEKIIFLVTKK